MHKVLERRTVFFVVETSLMAWIENATSTAQFRFGDLGAWILRSPSSSSLAVEGSTLLLDIV